MFPHRNDYERREHPRSGPTYRLDVVIPGSDALAHVVDISAGGLQIRYSEAGALDGVEKLEVEFPRWVDLGMGMDVTGRVVWFGQVGEETYECGFCFDEISSEKRELIRTLMERLMSALREDGLAPLDPEKPELDDEVPLSVFF